MANLEITETPSFSAEVEQLEITTPAHASVFNRINKRMLENEVYLNQTKADKSTLPTQLKNPYALTVQTNGTNQAIYDGSAAKTVNITPSNIGAAASSHNHTKAQITDFPTTLKNPAALTIQLNGSSQGAYDGSGAKTININYSNVGAAASSHTHSASQVSGLPTKLPANGGNADTTDGYHFMVATSKPSSINNNTICFVYE